MKYSKARYSETILLDPLTDRELEILSLLSKGLSNREIALKISLSLETIKWYNRQIYSKLNVGSRTQAVAKARELGLFDGPDDAERVTSATAHNLPTPLSSFIGRRREMAEVQQLLRTSRLVTLTGPGGAGKTRLALEVAASVVESYEDGVFFVSLAGASNASQLPKAIAQELGIVERPNHSLQGIVQRYLQNKKMLLLLDNFEHLLAAGPLVTDLLASTPRLTILVTSREALRLTGEHTYLVPPLGLPDPAQTTSATDLSAAESVMLFVQRARAASSTFHMSDDHAWAVAGICLHLDGLPLAIELAAARINLFSPEQLLERLHNRLGVLVEGPRDLLKRQRTLRGTLDWSYHLLDEAEKALFARLAVFRKGRSLDAIEAVCGFEPVTHPVDRVSALLNKSLLYREAGPSGKPRFYMLETIHEYARERLAELDEQQEVQNRHLAYFVSLAEKMERGYLGHNQLNLVAQTEAEMGNVRAAFEWAVASEQIEMAARLISGVDYYFRYKDGLVEGYGYFQKLADRINEISAPNKARFLLGAGRLAWYNNDIDQGKRFNQQARQIARSLENRQLEAYCLIGALFDPNDLQELETAEHSCLAGLALFRELNDVPGIAHALNVLGEVVRLQGDIDRAKEVYEEALVFARDAGETNRQDMIKINLGYIAYSKGKFEQARDVFISILRNKTEPRAWQSVTCCLSGLAAPLSQLGEPEKAARLLGADTAMRGEIGMDHQPEDQLVVAEYVSDVKAKLDEATFMAAWKEGQAMTWQQAVAYALGD